MMLHRLVVLFTMLACLAWPSFAQAKRVALVIGNDIYENVQSLSKAANDARAMEKTLTAIGFDTIRGENLSRRAMNRKLLEFAARLKPGDEALFFYAGHGVEIQGRNYLLPVDVPNATAGQDEFIKSEAIASDVILDHIREKGARISILILDACRDNPFKQLGTRSLGGRRGLARALAPEGTFIMYSAGVGQSALDALGDDDPHPNSVFTRSLIPLLTKPGFSLTRTARLVRKDVQKLAKTVSHDQRPAYYDEVTGDFQFTPGDLSNAAATSTDSCAIWPQINHTRSKAQVEAFLAACPTGIFANLAKARQEELEGTKIAVGIVPTTERPSGQGVPLGECDAQAAGNADERAIARGVPLSDIDGKSAIAACLEAVRKHPSEARFIYQLGRGYLAVKNYSAALRVFRQAAKANYPAAISNVGFMYDNGHGVARDYQTALDWYQRAAELGNVAAMHNVALLYDYGQGVGKDYSQARIWYKRAADLGYGDAMNSLGLLHYHGQGGPQDYAKALDWYERAVSKRNASAANSIGAMYATGSGVEVSQVKAARWYTKGAALGSATAMYNLGAQYENGRGVQKNFMKALSWYRKSAAASDTDAMYAISLMYEHGRGVAKSAVRAIEWVKKSAESGNANAMYALSVKYSKGHGVRKDEAVALSWSTKSANAGNSDAMYSVGVDLDDGRGGAKNPSASADWIFKALKAGNAIAIKAMTTKPAAWSLPFRKALQRLMRDAGVYRGSIDGNFGSGTRAAIARLQPGN